jgi:hypothetical protein
MRTIEQRIFYAVAVQGPDYYGTPLVHSLIHSFIFYTEQIDHLKPEIYINNIYKFISYLTEKTRVPITKTNQITPHIKRIACTRVIGFIQNP